MKKSTLLRRGCCTAIALAAIMSIAGAQAPPTISLQGTLLDNNDDPISGSRDYSIQFFEDQAGTTAHGPAITGSVVLSDRGRFVIEINPANQLFDISEAWYELAIDSDATPNGIDANDFFPNLMKVTSVPFAHESMEALDSDKLGGTSAADYALQADLQGHSLDDAYDAGSIINADSGKVEVQGSGGLLSESFIWSETGFVVRDPVTAASVGTLLYSSSGPVLELEDENGQITVRGGSSVSDGGFHYLYDNSGNVSLYLDGDDAGQPLIDMKYSSSAQSAIELDADDGDGFPIINLFSSSGTNMIELDGGEGGAAAFRMSDGTNNTVRLDASASGGGGDIELLNSLGDLTVDIDGDASGDSASVSLYKPSGRTIHLDADDVDGAGQISLFDTNGVETVEIQAVEGAGQGGQIRFRKPDGTTSIEIDGDFNGEGRVTTEILEITGGSDLSEQFDVNDATVQPGMVLCIDPDNPGELTISQEAYDFRVAGIVSGAGGIKTGMMMGQRGTEADGQHPIALSGRVYCQADATQDSIRPGDLLTTSDLPGHAMKAGDPMRSQGAIIGKAMTGLDEGTGLILVLVSLQ